MSGGSFLWMADFGGRLIGEGIRVPKINDTACVGAIWGDF